MAAVWEFIADLINSILNVVFSFLPVSPFKDVFTAMADNTVIQYLNWIIPVGELLSMITVWLGAIITFYAYQVVLRWIKAIGD